MIHHLSIPATDTRAVADVLAALTDGQVTAFGPYRDSWIVWFGDEHGSAIEVYPVGTEMYPPQGPGQALFRDSATPSPYVATHAAVSVRRTVEQIEQVAAAQGWRAVVLPRGGFDVVEFWVENHVMLELLTPQMAAAYLSVVPRRGS
jgi:hypothetical protein